MRNRQWFRQHWPVAAIILVFVLVGLWRLDFNGPFFDEGIYLVAGWRTWQGYGLSDNYLTWFAGSLAYPVIGYIGYYFGGLLGARLIGVFCLAIAAILVSKFAARTFGQETGVWAAFIFAVAAPTLYTAKLAVYDPPAILCVAAAFYLAARAIDTDDRGQFGWVGIAFGLGVVFKYPAMIMGLSLFAYILARRGRRAIGDAIILLTTLAVTLFLGLAPFGLDVIDALFRRTMVVPRFGFNFSMVAESTVYYIGVPFFLALVSVMATRKSRLVPSALLLGMLVFPAYHLSMIDPTGIPKHMVFGLVSGAPLAAVVMSRLWSGSLARPIAALLGLLIVALAGYQLPWLERSFPDVRGIAQFLQENMEPGDRVIANDSWSYRLELLNRLGSPWELADDYLVPNGMAGDLNQYRWFVNEHGSYAFDAQSEGAILGPNTWQIVYTSTVQVVGLGKEGAFFEYPIVTEVWRRN